MAGRVVTFLAILVLGIHFFLLLEGTPKTVWAVFRLPRTWLGILVAAGLIAINYAVDRFWRSYKS